MWKEFDRKANLKIRKKIIDNKSDKAVIMFSYWTGTSRIYIPLMTRLGKKYNYILYEYPNEIMSKDAKLSINYIKEILADAAKTIKQLRKDGVKEISLVGSSFGSDLSLKLANSLKVDKIILNMMDRNIAICVFESPVLSLLKNSFMRQGIKLKELDKLYHFISPEYNISHIKKSKVKILIIISKNDIFCNYEEIKPFLDILKKKRVRYTLHKHRFLGHVLSMFYNLSFPGRILRFIKNN